jgi:hypothetical protein
MHGLFAITGQPFENLSAGGVGEGLEDEIRSRLHAGIITSGLWVVNPE